MEQRRLSVGPEQRERDAVTQQVGGEDRRCGHGAREDDRRGDHLTTIALALARVIEAEELGDGLETKEDVQEGADEQDDLEHAVIGGRQKICVQRK